MAPVPRPEPLLDEGLTIEEEEEVAGGYDADALTDVVVAADEVLDVT